MPALVTASHSDARETHEKLSPIHYLSVVAFPGALTYLRASETRVLLQVPVCDIVCEVWRNLCRICSLKSGATPEEARIFPRRGVAQPGSAPEWGSGGREFESRRPD